MKILIIEDNDIKYDDIYGLIVNFLDESVSSPKIQRANTMLSANNLLLTKKFDLIVFDMYLPRVNASSGSVDCSEELIMNFSTSLNYQSDVIALTQYAIENIENMHAFNQAGITLVEYRPNEKDGWKEALKQKINKASQRLHCDFLIFCALPDEADAYEKTKNSTIGDPINIQGLNCKSIIIGDYQGYIITPNHMGLVNMAILATKGIEIFLPEIVSMSGICAGVTGESDYLDIIVGNVCWEYQTGKWKDGVFKQEPYQVKISSDLETDLRQSISSKVILDEIRSGLFDSKLKTMKILVAPLSSGSAVISDNQMMDEIGNQHRKMAGLEMEMYSLYEAASQSLCKPKFFGAKAVVDMGDTHKSDDYHEYGCVMSARYTLLMLKKQLDKARS